MNQAITGSASSLPYAVRTRKFTWGTFVAGVLVTLGLMLGWLLLICWGMQMVPAEERADGVVHEYLAYTTAGEPVISQTLKSSTSRILDLRRQVLDIPAEDANRRPNYLRVPRPVANSLIPAFKVNALGESKDHSAYWYIVENCDRAGFGYFAAVHPLTKRETGFVGRHGWQVNRPAVSEQFELRSGGIFGGLYGAYGGQNPYEAGRKPIGNLILLSKGEAFQVDLDQHELRPIGNVSEVLAAAEVFTTRKRTSGAQSWTDTVSTGEVALRTPDQIVLVNLVNGEEKTWQLSDSQVRDADAFLFLENQELLASKHETLFDESTGITAGYRYHLTWQNSAGDVLKTDSVEFPATTARQWAIFEWTCGLSGTPLIIGFVNLFIFPMQLAMIKKCSYLSALGRVLPRVWPMLVLAICFAGLAIYLARRHAQSRGIVLHPAWYVALALFGIPGYFGYRWHRDWPPIKIPAAPAANGTEVLVPAS